MDAQKQTLSVLFDGPVDAKRIDEQAAPAFFVDLNLDQVVDAVTLGRAEYDLKPFFYAPLGSVASIAYRHQVMRDLVDGRVRAAIESFAKQMREMREQFRQSQKLHYQRQKQSYLLDAVEIYCRAVDVLTHDLSASDVRSTGLTTLLAYLRDYVASSGFRKLVAETASLRKTLAEISYCVNIKANRVRVTRYDGESDYSTEVLQTFEKFAQGAAQDYRVKLGNWSEMDHIEVQVLDCVAKLYPDAFATLAEYCRRHRGYLDPVIRRFDREVQFYLGYLKFTERLEAAGLSLCFPEINDESKQISAYDTFDVALASTLADEGRRVVRNDFYLRDPERIFVVTGPNQGGKTTFARTFGQLHYLAALGLPVPGREAHTYLFDRLFTHFEKQEDLRDLRSKLEDDLVRIHEILEAATPRSIVIMNEVFTSTTVADALFLGRKTIEELTELGALCVYVTFVDELSRLGDATVSMVSSVQPDDPAIRTFKVERRQADGRAYAINIAEKYGLTREGLARRLAS